MGDMIMPLSFFRSSLLGLDPLLSWRSLESQRSRCMAKRRRVFKQNVSDSYFSLTFSFFLFHFINQFGMVALTYL